LAIIDSTTKIIIWPEGSTSTKVSEKKMYAKNSFLKIKMDANTWKRTWVIGSILYDSQKRYYNSALIFSPNKKPAYYNKKYLVPFVEYIPDFKFTRTSFILENNEFFLTSGANANVNPDMEISIAICYETLFGEWIAKRKKLNPHMIAILSNESWCMGISNELLQITSLRAIETRKYIARSTINGIPAIIDSNGRITRTSFTVDNTAKISCHKGFVLLNNYQSFYSKHGDYLGEAATLIGIFMILMLSIKDIFHK
jgi:apolipoprotein N-acyltransferase